MDVEELRPDRFFNLVYHFAVRNADDQNEIAKFDRRLWQPPKREQAKPIPKESPWSAEREKAAFNALRAQMTG